MLMFKNKTIVLLVILLSLQSAVSVYFIYRYRQVRSGDLNHDGIVNLLDYSILAGNYGRGR